MTAQAGGPGHRPPPISEDDRDTALRRLQEVHAEGHISHQDLSERLHQVLTAETRPVRLAARAAELRGCNSPVATG